MVWRPSLAAVALVVMEALSLFVLGGLLAGIGGRAGPSALTLLAAALAGYALARALRRFDFSRRMLIAAGFCVSLAGLWTLGSAQYGEAGNAFDFSSFGQLLTNPAQVIDHASPVVAGLIVLGLAWLRGVLIGSRARLTHGSILSSLTVGLLIVVAGLSVGRAAVSSRAIDSAALPFLVAGLFSLALVHLGQSEHIQGDSWRGPWLLVLLGTTILLALIGAVVGLLPLDQINAILAPVGSMLLMTIDLLIYIIALPVVLLVNLVLTHLLAGHLKPVEFGPAAGQQFTRQLQQQAHHGGFALLIANLAHLLVLLVVGGLVAFVIWWAFNRLEHEPGGEESQRDSVEAEGALRSDIQAALAKLRGVRRRGPRRTEPVLPPGIMRVRHLYLSLLRRAEGHGVGRPSSATAREFAPVLRAHYQSHLPELVTHRFAESRYGLIEPSSEDLTRIEKEIEALQRRSP